MTNSNRTASTSVARKRKAEKVDDPEYAEKFVDRVNEVMYPRDAERASELLDRVSGRLKETLGGHLPDEVREALSILDLHLTPPPVPAAPWERLSTTPTLAAVSWPGHEDKVGMWWLSDDRFVESEEWMPRREAVTSVRLLATHDPVTHVPVERALIDEALQIADAFDVDPAWPFRYVEKIAALADGAQS